MYQWLIEMNSSEAMDGPGGYQRSKRIERSVMSSQTGVLMIMSLIIGQDY